MKAIDQEGEASAVGDSIVESLMDSGVSHAIFIKTLVHALAEALTHVLTDRSLLRITLNGEMLAQVEMFQDKQERLQ